LGQPHAEAVAKRKMEMQQRAQGIRMKYIDKFATVLNANQVNRIYEVESLIQKKLKERRNQARDQYVYRIMTRRMPTWRFIHRRHFS
jgi:hypothetical protein